MKKVFTLLSLLMATVCAMAQTTFSGTWHSRPGNFSDFESTVIVTVESNGTSSIEMKNMTLGNDDLGTIVIRNVYTEQSGTTYSFNMGSNTTFDITEGNLSGVTKGVFEGYGTMDSESLYLKASYFDYGTTSLRMVEFNGTKVNTGGGGGSDEPTIVSTESFSNPLKVTNTDGQSNKSQDVKAVLCKYSDDTYGLTINQVASADGAYGSMTFNGLKYEEEDGNAYISGDVDVLVDETSSLYGKKLTAEVSAVIDEEGALAARIDILDTEDEAFLLVLEYGDDGGDEPQWPYEAISVPGVLTSYTNTADGESTDSKASVLTITPTENGKCSLKLTNATLPGTTITLGTVVIEGVALDANEELYTLDFSASNVEATTEAEHPYYQTLEVKTLSGDAALSYGEDSTESAKANIKFTINNNDTETVDYTFSTNGLVDGIASILESANRAARIYTISGMGVNKEQRGINIVRLANGKVVKMLVK